MLQNSKGVIVWKKKKLLTFLLLKKKYLIIFYVNGSGYLDPILSNDVGDKIIERGLVIGRKIMVDNNLKWLL